MKKVVLLEAIHTSAIENLTAAGFSVELYKKSFNSHELIEKLKDANIVGIRSKTQLSEDVLQSLPNLEAIGAFCIGTNQIDLNFANAQGIPVFNAPYSNTRSVAELVIAEIVALSRKLGDISAAAHLGKWTKSATGSYEVRGKTIGIIGYGHIGSQVGILAESMGLKVYYFDIVKKLPLGNATSCDSLADLLKASDFVTLHVPETPETQGMISREQLLQMKKGSYLLNLSRGTVVVIEDLVEFLKSNHLAGAAIDVYPIEPEKNDDVFTTPLQGLPNVILTPHIGGSTEEAQESIGLEVSESLKRFYRFGSTLGAVNFPQLDATLRKGTKRLLNIHLNKPGVLGEINGLISAKGLNISAQYLSTDERIGYVMVDVDDTSGLNELIEQLNHVKLSLKTRWVG